MSGRRVGNDTTTLLRSFEVHGPLEGHVSSEAPVRERRKMSLPALPVTADTRSITERVNVLIRDYNSGRVAKLADLLSLHDDDATVFLGADVPLDNTGLFFDGPNSSPVGNAGQKWLIIAAAVIDSPAGPTTGEMAIHDGTTFIASQCDVGPNANWPAIPHLAFEWRLSGPTTFTMKCRANSTSAVLRTTGLASAVANKATFLTVVRLK